MTFVDYYEIPRLGINDRFVMGLVDCPVDACHDPWIFQGRVAVVARYPLPEGQIQTLELASNVADQARGRQIQNSEAGRICKQSLYDQSCFDRFAKSHFVRDKRPIQVGLREDVLD
jgi:hypothetical protein